MWTHIKYVDVMCYITILILYYTITKVVSSYIGHHLYNI